MKSSSPFASLFRAIRAKWRRPMERTGRENMIRRRVKRGYSYAKRTLKTIRHSYSCSALYNVFYRYAGHANYTKFIIVTSGRSGSSLLVSYLDSHSHIRCYGELFNPSEFERRTSSVYPKNRRLQQLFLTQPDRFLQEEFFSRYYPKHILCLGFKLPYHQTLHTGQTSLLKSLAANKTLKIIHLIRRNWLEAHLSGVTAAQTRICHLFSERQRQHVSVSLDAESCLKYFRTVETLIKTTEVLFREHERFMVYYEDLVQEKEKQLLRIQDFLELPYEDMYTSFKKINVFSLSDSITNYDELKQQFRGTKYARFFTE